MVPAPVTFSIGDKLTVPSSEASLNCPLAVLSFAAPPADLSSSCMAPSSSPFSAEASLPSAAAGEEEAGIILEIAEPRCKRRSIWSQRSRTSAVFGVGRRGWTAGSCSCGVAC